MHSSLLADSAALGEAVSWPADAAVGCASPCASAACEEAAEGLEDAFETAVAVTAEEGETSLSVPELLMTSLARVRCL